MVDGLLIVLLIAVVGAWLLLQQCYQSRLSYYANLIPGPRKIPIIGQFNAPTTGRDALKVRYKMIETYGDIYKSWLSNLLYIFITDPYDIEAIIGNKNYIEKGGTSYKILLQWLGTGLLISGGDKWHSRRKTLTPTFHFKILEQFIEVFHRKGCILIEKLQPKADGKIFNIGPFISNYTLDVICETAMGVPVNAQESDHSPYIEAVTRMNDYATNTRYKHWLINKFERALKINFDLDNIIETLHGFTNSVIRIKREESASVDSLEETNAETKKKTAFLELLINLSNSPESSIKTDEDIREEVDTFMFEGHDTTSSVLSSLICMLAKHQNIQDKVAEEVNELIQGDDYSLSYKDLQSLKYTEMVIKEALRLYPSVPTFSRHIGSDIKLPSGYILPAGSVVQINVFNLHRNPKYYTNPEEFNPDNFLPENINKRHNFAYIPFSAGPRNCIGQKFAMLEMKSILSKLVYNYKFEYGGADTEMQTSCGVILKSVNGYLVKLSTRKKSVPQEINNH